MVLMVPVFAKEPSNVVKELSMVAKEPSLVPKEATKVAKDPVMSPWAKRCNFYSYDGRKDVTFSEKLGEITSQTKTRKLRANHGLSQDKILYVPKAKRCNFYSYDGRKDVTLRNRICEILTKSRKPPKVEDFVTQGQSFRCRCRWFPIVPDPGGHASMRLKFLAQRYTSINDYRWTFPIIAVQIFVKVPGGHASMDQRRAAERSESLVQRSWTQHAIQNSYIFSPKWTIFNVRFSARFCQSPENHQKWRIASLVQGFCSYPSKNFLSSRFGHLG